MEISSLYNYLMSTEEKMLLCVKDFEEQKRRKRTQGKQNVNQKHESSYES